MTLEDRLNELETALQTLRRDMQPKRKFKVGDEVVVSGRVTEVDEKDDNLSYRVELDSDASIVDWFRERDMHPKAP